MRYVYVCSIINKLFNVFFVISVLLYMFVVLFLKCFLFVKPRINMEGIKEWYTQFGFSIRKNSGPSLFFCHRTLDLAILIKLASLYLLPRKWFKWFLLLRKLCIFRFCSAWSCKLHMFLIYNNFKINQQLEILFSESLFPGCFLIF